MREMSFRFFEDNKFWYFSIPYMSDEMFNKLQEPESDNRIIEQYTGLKDKNGKKIYEGDILKIDGSKMYDNDPEYIGIFEVKIDIGTWGIEIWFDSIKGYECSTHIMDENYDNIEIIGNIHKNK